MGRNVQGMRKFRNMRPGVAALFPAVSSVLRVAVIDSYPFANGIWPAGATRGAL
jgi:hypothetical protein